MEEHTTPLVIRIFLAWGIASIFFLAGWYIFGLVPGIGWIIGGGLMVMAIFAFLTPFTTKGSMLYGRCPRCDTKIKVMASKKALTCPTCRRRLLVTTEGYQLA